MILKPSLIAALVARAHGQVILSREEFLDAERLTVRAEINERGELVLRSFPHTRLESEGHEDHDPDS